jgi:hypothetical protein
VRPPRTSGVGTAASPSPTPENDVLLGRQGLVLPNNWISTDFQPDDPQEANAAARARTMAAILHPSCPTKWIPPGQVTSLEGGALGAIAATAAPEKSGGAQEKGRKGEEEEIDGAALLTLIRAF